MRRRRTYLALAGGLSVLTLALPQTAGAADPLPEYPRFTYSINVDGGGEISVYSDPGTVVGGPLAPPTLERCLPAAPCVAAAPSSTLDYVGVARLDVSDDPAGTTYRAAQNGQTVESLPWRGRVVNLSPPTVTAPPAVGAVPIPVAGTWGGGWGIDEQDYLDLRACKTDGGADCESLSQRCPIPSRFAGRWLAVSDLRSDPLVFAAGPELAFDRTVAAFTPSPARVLSVVGQIAPGPQTADCRAPKGRWLGFDQLRNRRYVNAAGGNFSLLLAAVPDRLAARGTAPSLVLRAVSLPASTGELRISRGSRSMVLPLTLSGSAKGFAVEAGDLRRIAGQSGRRVTVTLVAGDSAPMVKHLRVSF